MKGSDYVARFVQDLGTCHAFVLTGGACAHIIDSMGRLERFDLVCVQHEQAAAMAADCYSRVSGRLGVTVVTSGPGATNLITGIACAWFDSIPVLHLAGQVNTFEQKGSLAIRQMGFQETDIVPMVSSITKFAAMVRRPEDLRRTLEEAVYWARDGRQGPALVDVPFDVQTADVDPDSMPAFVPPARPPEIDHSADFETLIEQLLRSNRPVLLVGGGVKRAGARAALIAVAAELQMPIVTTWSGLDVIPADHPLYRGQIGVYGSRSANFTVQNADFLLSVGSRLDSRVVGGKFASFAREAFRVVVDIDRAEVDKERVAAHLPVVMDAREFCIALSKQLPSARRSIGDWIETTARWRNEFAVHAPGAPASEFVNPYLFMQLLASALPSDAIVVTDCGANLCWTVQGFAPTGDQRVISAMGNSPMGYSLPASVGAWFADPKKPIVCVIGDGGLQINLQEFQTVAYNRIPLKIIVLNNHGYGIIKQFQDLYLDGRHIATGEGFSCPDYSKIAAAYELDYARVSSDADAEGMLADLVARSGPLVIDVMLDPDQKIEPKLGWGKPIEDQLPLLPREEFRSHMLIAPLAEDDWRAPNEIN